MLKFEDIVPVARIENKTKLSLKVLKNSGSRIIAYTTRKSLIFYVLCTSFEEVSFGININSLKSPTLSGAKIKKNKKKKKQKKKKNAVYLVIRSRGYITVLRYIQY